MQSCLRSERRGFSGNSNRREGETNSARSVHKRVAMASRNEKKKKEKHVVHPREVRWMAEER